MKNESTGEMTPEPRDGAQQQRQLQELLALIAENTFTEAFVPPRDDAPAPDPFAGG